jgi:hypothetical protein
VGITLGIVCRFVPPEYQAPCTLLVKLVGVFFGTS